MFSQPPEEEILNKSIPVPNNAKRKRKKKIKNRSAKKDFRRQSRFAKTMSSWAEHFTFGATWQLKHQIAYWKSRAKALECENKILHDIIRKNYVESVPDIVHERCDTDSPANDEETEDGDFVVSEEYIQFLKENAKFKEEARLERERLEAEKAKNDSDDAEADPSNVEVNTKEKQKELYGVKWQKITALETMVLSEFIDESDKQKVVYWPNIPLNFNFS